MATKVNTKKASTKKASTKKVEKTAAEKSATVFYPNIPLFLIGGCSFIVLAS